MGGQNKINFANKCTLNIAESNSSNKYILIEDTKFRNYLVNEFKFQSVKNQVFFDPLQIKKIDVSKMEINNLNEISIFKNLEELNVSDNNLVNLNITNNKKLRVLHCCNTLIEELDLTQNKDLNEVDIRVSPNLLYIYINENNEIPAGWEKPSYTFYKTKNIENLNIKNYYLSELNKNVTIKAERPFTFYGKILNYNICNEDEIGIFEENKLIGKYKYNQDKENGAISINMFPKNRFNKRIKIVLSTKLYSEVFYTEIDYSEKDSNYQNIPSFSIDDSNSIKAKNIKENNKYYEKNINLSKGNKLYTIPEELTFTYLN